MQVKLSDFSISLPLSADSRRTSALWTEFESRDNLREDECSAFCESHLDCFDSFTSKSGCFFVKGNHREIHAGSAPEPTWSKALTSSTERKITGYLYGCVQQSGTNHQGLCLATSSNGADGTMTFQVSPEYHGAKATLTFSVVMEVGEQKFESQSSSIQLHRGLPILKDAVVVLIQTFGTSEVILEPNVTIDSFGNIEVLVSKFDPTNLTELQLSVVPLLADPVPCLGSRRAIGGL